MYIRLLSLGALCFLGLTSICRADLTSDMEGCLSLLAEENPQAAEQALPICQRVADSGLVSGSNLAAAHTNVGTAYYFLGNYPSAIAEYDRAIDVNPDDASALYMRGTAYHLSKEFAKAIADLNRAISIEPKNASFLSMRGLAYYGLKNFEMAEEDFGRSIEVMPEYVLYYYRRAKARAERGKYDATLEDLNQAIAIEPDYEAALHFRGIIYLRINRLDEALRDFNRILELNPESWDGFYFRAQTYMMMGRFAESLVELNKVMSLTPGNTDVRGEVGKVLFLLERYEEAAVELSHVAADDTYGQLYLALAQEHLGEPGFKNLGQKIAGTEKLTWPILLGKYFVGATDKEAIDYYSRVGKIGQPMNGACEASFFLGEHALVQHDNQNATANFEKALELCAVESIYYVASAARLD